jgi:threonine dehydrogenase-like Zn-dependent dehydrogenase
MKRLWFLSPGRLEWRDAEAPTLQQPHDAIVRPIAATTCDLDVMVLRGATPFEGPIALGHEAVGQIVELGEATPGLYRGQLVVLPWHVSCGQCDRCRHHRPNTCRSYPTGAMYGLDVGGAYGSFFSDLVRVPHASSVLTPLPLGLDPVACASASDNLPFGYELTVPHLAACPGADVLILGGCGSVALYAAAFARAGGAREVVYVDTDRDRLERAERYGVHAVEGPPPRRMDRMYPITVDASSSAAGLRCALSSTEPEGQCSSVGTHWSDVAFPMRELYSKGIRFYTGRGKGLPHICDALEFVVSKRIDPKIAITEVVPFEEGHRALADPSMKMVLTRV